MYMLEIGARIRKARKAQGLTQAALAGRAGIARETLNQFEIGVARELGFSRVNRLLRSLGLELIVADSPTTSIDWVALAAQAGSTGFREPLAPDELLQALLTGVPPARKAPHLRRLLEDSPPTVIRGLVSQVSLWAEPRRLEKNLAALGRKLDVQMSGEWTTPG